MKSSYHGIVVIFPGLAYRDPTRSHCLILKDDRIYRISGNIHEPTSWRQGILEDHFKIIWPRFTWYGLNSAAVRDLITTHDGVVIRD